MTEPLRPLSVGELLDRTFSLYRQNFKLLVGVAILGPTALLCFQMALAFVGVGGRNARGMVQNPASVAMTLIAGVIFYLIGHAVSVAATTRAVAAVYLGKVITVAEAFASVKGRVLRVIGVMLAAMVIAGLVGMALVGAGAAIFAAAIAGGKSAGGPVGVAVGGVIGAAALVVSIVAAIAFAMRYALSVQACIVEDLTVKASLVRSKLLTKDARKRILTVLFVCTMVIYAVTLVSRSIDAGAGRGQSAGAAGCIEHLRPVCGCNRRTARHGRAVAGVLRRAGTQGGLRSATPDGLA